VTALLAYPELRYRYHICIQGGSIKESHYTKLSKNRIEACKQN